MTITAVFKNKRGFLLFVINLFITCVYFGNLLFYALEHGLKHSAMHRSTCLPVSRNLSMACIAYRRKLGDVGNVPSLWPGTSVLQAAGWACSSAEEASQRGRMGRLCQACPQRDSESLCKQDKPCFRHMSFWLLWKHRMRSWKKTASPAVQSWCHAPITSRHRQGWRGSSSVLFFSMAFVLWNAMRVSCFASPVSTQGSGFLVNHEKDLFPDTECLVHSLPCQFHSPVTESMVLGGSTGEDISWAISPGACRLSLGTRTSATSPITRGTLPCTCWCSLSAPGFDAISW